ncbi:DNA-3-methyladenine glycosylase I [Jannaschia aquimarina]|uniref:Tag protein n=1 Tax=Jannaschia aquimarina TaxID=935700 RepID=A0A0D1EG62_9RHOB|nr:DNA-3-methyladenine glycosylase I [Jannaschia aquimarina]KIT16654.1 DNA-3-methyladenine glycosylase 1 [Jannaschia aquimarina]SNS93226.1 DNA-3-methyladenine glycosylase I [Jannaschia aquimarina]
MERCGWVGEDPLYRAYHDEEWGVPERDGRAMWEALQLEGMQAGLSWITILRKREGFRRAFAGFDPEVIAGWGSEEVERLLGDPGIVRHRGKIEAVIGNARAYLAMDDFAAWAWDWVDGLPLQPARGDLADVPAKTDLSESISKALKKAGFRFCGPTTVYAWMQATGMVNDHVTTCDRHADLARAPAAVTDR